MCSAASLICTRICAQEKIECIHLDAAERNNLCPLPPQLSLVQPLVPLATIIQQLLILKLVTFLWIKLKYVMHMTYDVCST